MGNTMQVLSFHISDLTNYSLNNYVVSLCTKKGMNTSFA